MSNLTVSKKDVVVLFDLLKLTDVPCSIKNMPIVTAREYAAISKSFYDSRLLVVDEKGLHTDKGLEEFLLPLKTSDAILLFNYGIGGVCHFNVSVYFSKKGVVVLRENDTEKIDFLTVKSLHELLFILPSVKDISSEEDAYFSYWLFYENIAIAHCAILNISENSVEIVESQREKGCVKTDEVKYKMSVVQYDQLLKNKLKEVGNVFNC